MPKRETHYIIQLIRFNSYKMLTRFIGGSNILHARQCIQRTPFTAIYDRAKEGCKTHSEGQQFVIDMVADANELKGDKDVVIALKYSSFYPRNASHLKQGTRVARMAYTIYKLKEVGVHRVLMDAEELSQNDVEAAAMAKLLPVFNKSEPFIYKTYQMYKRNAMDELVADLETNEPLGVKLVRGAYHHVDGGTGVLHSTKFETDSAYNMALEHVIRAMLTTHRANPYSLELLVASHNDTSLEIASKYIRDHPHLTTRIAFAQLLGMNDMASYRLQKSGFRVYKYVPYGSFVETFPYLTRRLYENYEMLRYII